jgi:16S rRNA (guanine966-N2)-methyltransferase
VRVVAGALRGRRLRAPQGRRTRPTADRVREAVFSMLGSVEGMRVLDLFAGSGALGIEALSRGAGAALFVDRDPRAVAAIHRNLEALGVEGTVRRADALAFLASRGVRRAAPFDLVFVDPPYSSAGRVAGPLSEQLPALLSKDALVVTESDKRTPLDLALPLDRERAYGDTRIALHHAR